MGGILTCFSGCTGQRRNTDKTDCLPGGAKTPFCDKLCPVHNCVREKGFDTCADCPETNECPTLRRIAANTPEVLERLGRLRAGK